MSASEHGARVRDVMTSPVCTLTPETGLKEAAARIVEAGGGALPVVDAGGSVIGVLSEADLLVKAGRPPTAAAARSYTGRGERRRSSGTLACDLMTRPAVTVSADAVVADAARLLHRYGLSRLPVVDGAGRPVGMVSRGDLLQVFLRDDDAIRHDVEARLAADGLAEAAVSVEDGVVTLRGVDVEDDRRHRMTEIAGGVDGVVAVRHRVRRGVVL